MTSQLATKSRQFLDLEKEFKILKAQNAPDMGGIDESFNESMLGRFNILESEYHNNKPSN